MGCPMLHVPTCAEVEATANEAAISMRQVCRLAGIAPRTFERWRSGGPRVKGPSVDSLNRMVAVINHRLKGIDEGVFGGLARGTSGQNGAPEHATERTTGRDNCGTSCSGDNQF